MALIGFKRLTIRVLTGEAPVTSGEGQNVFVIEGKTGEGATQEAKIDGLSTDPVKTYGSDAAYHVSRKGVGDVKAEIKTVDIVETAKATILGYLRKDDITYIGSDTEAPYCSLLFESSNIDGTPALLGIFKGSFSLNSVEMKTLGDKTEELPGESLTYTAIASDDADTKGEYVASYSGSDETSISKLKAQLHIIAGA